MSVRIIPFDYGNRSRSAVDTAVANLIPDCGTVDFYDADAAAGYAHLLMSLYQVCGGFISYDRKDSRIAALENRARQWADNCMRRAHCMEIHKLPAVLYLFDWVYRLGYGAPAPEVFVNENYERIFSAWRGGNKLISLYDIMSIVRQAPDVYDGSSAAGLLWYAGIEKKWIDESALRCRFDNIPQNDALLRIIILLADDLGAFLPEQQEYKRKIVGNYLAALDDAGGESGKTLKTKLLFANRIFPDFISSKEHEKHECRLLRALSVCSTIDEASRRAYSLDLEYRLCNS